MRRQYDFPVAVGPHRRHGVDEGRFAGAASAYQGVTHAHVVGLGVDGDASLRQVEPEAGAPAGSECASHP